MTVLTCGVEEEDDEKEGEIRQPMTSKMIMILDKSRDNKNEGNMMVLNRRKKRRDGRERRMRTRKTKSKKEYER